MSRGTTTLVRRRSCLPSRRSTLTILAVRAQAADRSRAAAPGPSTRRGGVLSTRARKKDCAVPYWCNRRPYFTLQALQREERGRLKHEQRVLHAPVTRI